jgi:hypothetical protein
VECVRDATTGRYLPKAMAKRRPKTTVTEKRRQPRLKNGRFARSY